MLRSLNSGRRFHLKLAEKKVIFNLSGERGRRGGARCRGGRFRTKSGFEGIDSQVVEEAEEKAAGLQHRRQA